MDNSLHQIKIEQKDISKPLSPQNCLISMDGKPLIGIKKISFEADIGGTPTVKMELTANVRMDVAVTKNMIKEENPFKTDFKEDKNKKGKN